MANIGERATLKILREQPPGLYLDAGVESGELGEVLLPRGEMPPQWEVGGTVDVFLYCDSEDRPVATLKHPKAMPGEFAYMKVIATTTVGAFLDWGLRKDLLVPFREQRNPMEVGRSYVVHVYVDPHNGRIVASRRLSRFLSEEKPTYQAGEKVDLLLYGKTDLGYKAIINGKHSGVIFANQVFRTLRAGERTTGYVTQVRDDGKIDLSLYESGAAGSENLEGRILRELTENGGRMDLCDSSPPDDIYDAFGVSKKLFKRATGALFRQRKIVIGKDGIRLVGSEDG